MACQMGGWMGGWRLCERMGGRVGAWRGLVQLRVAPLARPHVGGLAAKLGDLLGVRPLVRRAAARLLRPTLVCHGGSAEKRTGQRTLDTKDTSLDGCARGDIERGDAGGPICVSSMHPTSKGHYSVVGRRLEADLQSNDHWCHSKDACVTYRCMYLLGFDHEHSQAMLVWAAERGKEGDARKDARVHHPPPTSTHTHVCVHTHTHPHAQSQYPTPCRTAPTCPSTRLSIQRWPHYDPDLTHYPLPTKHPLPVTHPLTAPPPMEYP